MLSNNKNIIIWHLPGAAGNFLSRCINLLENFQCWRAKDSNKLPCTLEEKISLLTYERVKNKKQQWVHWVDFEDQVMPVTSTLTAQRLVEIRHPEFDHRQCVNSLQIYIDPRGCFDWMMANAIFKDSTLYPHYVIWGKGLVFDCNVYKVSLKELSTGLESFLIEFNKLCQYIGVFPTNKEIQAISALYLEWYDVSIKPNEVSGYMTHHGLY